MLVKVDEAMDKRLCKRRTSTVGKLIVSSTYLSILSSGMEGIFLNILACVEIFPKL